MLDVFFRCSGYNIIKSILINRRNFIPLPKRSFKFIWVVDSTVMPKRKINDDAEPSVVAAPAPVGRNRREFDKKDEAPQEKPVKAAAIRQLRGKVGEAMPDVVDSLQPDEGEVPQAKPAKIRKPRRRVEGDIPEEVDILQPNEKDEVPQAKPAKMRKPRKVEEDIPNEVDILQPDEENYLPQAKPAKTRKPRRRVGEDIPEDVDSSQPDEEHEVPQAKPAKIRKPRRGVEDDISEEVDSLQPDEVDEVPQAKPAKIRKPRRRVEEDIPEDLESLQPDKEDEVPQEKPANMRKPRRRVEEDISEDLDSLQLDKVHEVPQAIPAKIRKPRMRVEGERPEVGDLLQLDDEKEVPPAKPAKIRTRRVGVDEDSPEAGYSLQLAEEQEVPPAKPAKIRNRRVGVDEDITEPEDNLEIAEHEEKNKARGKKKAESQEANKKDEKIEKAPDPTEPKVTESKPKRGRKTKAEAEEQASPSPEKETKPKKATRSKPPTREPAVLVNQTGTKWENIDFSCSKLNAKAENFNLKITSWNVDGLRAWVKKGGLDIFKYAQSDIFCLQETKCNEFKMPPEAQDIEGYHRYCFASDKDGYAGVAIYTKVEPIDVQYGIGDDEYDDDEGRCITAEYEKFFLVCVYVPNSGRGLVNLSRRLKWNEAFKEFIKSMDNQKPVIITGDLNVAHSEIDLTNPSTNTKSAGFTKEEREGMTDFLQDGYVDTFRLLYPDKTGVYTFWTYMNKARSKNIGWRLDYFIVSERIKDNVCDVVVHPDVFGSDHCPLTLFTTI